MANLESGMRPEFEVITKEERIARDPRGLLRVTIIGDTVIVKKVTKQPSESTDAPIHPQSLAEDLKDLASRSVIVPRKIGEEE